MTYTERYLKMTAFGIADNSLDFDTTENTKKRAEEAKKSDYNASKPRFNELEFKNFEKKKNEFESGEIAVAFIKKHYQISDPMQTKVLSLYHTA